MISLPDRDDGTRSEKVDTVTLVEGDQRPMVSVQRFVRRMIRA
jgi:hypothetical protein